MKIARKLIAILISAAMVLSLTVTTAAQGYSIDTALTILKHLAGLEIIQPAQQAQYDFDGDGSITINDTLEVLKLLAGLPNLINNVPCWICDRNVITCPICNYCADCDWFERCDTYPAYGVDCCPCGCYWGWDWEEGTCWICGEYTDTCPGCDFCADCDPFERCDIYPDYGVDCCPCPMGTHTDFDWDWDWEWEEGTCWVCGEHTDTCPVCSYCADCDWYERCDTYPDYGVDCCPCPMGTHMDWDWDWDWDWEDGTCWICGEYTDTCPGCGYCADCDWYERCENYPDFGVDCCPCGCYWDFNALG
jgi:hypothetical protein